MLTCNNFNPQPATKVTETYRGVHWGKYSTKRSDFGGKKGPGPGEYDPHIDVKTKPDHLNMRDEDKNKKFDARIPRYHEWVVKEEEKKVGVQCTLVMSLSGMFRDYHVHELHMQCCLNPFLLKSILCTHRKMAFTIPHQVAMYWYCYLNDASFCSRYQDQVDMT